MTDDKILVFDTPDGIAYYRLCALIAALRIEVSTGMRHSRYSCLGIAQRQYGVKARKKAEAIIELEDIRAAMLIKKLGGVAPEQEQETS